MCVWHAEHADRRVASATRQRDRPLLRGVDAGKRVEQRRLAGAVRADDREDLAAVHLQRHVVQAVTPPKRSVTLSTSNTRSCEGRRSPRQRARGSSRHNPSDAGTAQVSALAGASSPCSSALATPCRDQPSGPEDHHQHDDGADPHQLVRGRHLVLQELRQPGEHRRTGHRARQRPHAAEHDVRHDEDRVVQHEVVGGEVRRSGWRRTRPRRLRSTHRSRTPASLTFVVLMPVACAATSSSRTAAHARPSRDSRAGGTRGRRPPRRPAAGTSTGAG